VPHEQWLRARIEGGARVGDRRKDEGYQNHVRSSLPILLCAGNFIGMIASDGVSRSGRLAQGVEQSGADAFFAWHPVSMGYLHGFRENAHERFMSLAIRASGEIVLIAPALSATQASRAGIRDVRSWGDGEDPMLLFAQLAQEWNLRSGILLVDDEMPSHMLLRMQETLPAALFKAGQEVLSNLMRVKDEAELAHMGTAAAIADGALKAGLAAIHPGATERQVQKALQDDMNRNGGRPTFCIIAAGANGAEPHHETDDTVIQEGDVVVMDYGCEVNGYNSDITRVACCGVASEEAKKVYATVYAAQEAGRGAIRAGVAAQDVDRAARKVIAQAGYGDFFVHRTGHGIGLRGHEDPYIVEGNDEPLRAGECFSVEPGIYLPGRFGVRIENIVTPTQSGHESFNEEPASELIEVSS
jgi:Xaa-Pro dipeptidase